MELNNESKTLFIPLIGKARISKDNLFFKDEKAEEIVLSVNYDLNSLKVSKWLSMYLSLRALIIDELCNDYLKNNDNVTVLHLGCGLDSRCLRINKKYKKWYDIDYESVIEMRKKYYTPSSNYEMIGSSVTSTEWLEQIDTTSNLLIVMEGLTMYLSEVKIKELIANIDRKFSNVHFIFDAYSKKAVKYSKKKNPVNQVSAKVKYGIDNFNDFLNINNNLKYINTHIIRKKENKLPFLTRFIFNHLYCGKISESLYKIYEFKL